MAKIKAFHKKTEQWVDLQYNNIKEAKIRNPHLCNFTYSL